MRLILGSLAQLMVMAAVVATALFVPVVALFALLSFALFGVSLSSFMTFGEAIAAYQGLAVWWAIVFVPALAYSAFVMPWQTGK
ncbi:MAG TPA: hypothetical protein VLX30_15510 [Burkholderiales bacterium]|nr:hypothetical protein [Burkholderiales bacterium]